MQAQMKTMRDDFAKLKEEMAMVVQCLSPIGEIDFVDCDNLHESWLLLLAFFKDYNWTSSFINIPQRRRLASSLLTINIESNSFITWT